MMKQKMVMVRTDSDENMATDLEKVNVLLEDGYYVEREFMGLDGRIAILVTKDDEDE